MKTLILQPWTTLALSGGTFIQGAESWLDVSEFADLGLWIDFQGGNSGTLYLETAPSWDSAYFQLVAGPVAIASPNLLVRQTARAASTVPLSRWLRWRLSLGIAVTFSFRIRVSPVRQSFVPPTQLGTVAFWIRGDLGVTGGTTNVTAWSDQSDVGDPNENLTASNNPTLNLADSSYGFQPTIGFASSSSQKMTSGAWATPLAQPCTWVVVAHNTSSSAT